MQSNHLSELQTTIKDLLSSDFSEAMQVLKAHLRPASRRYDEVILATERFNRIERALQKSILTYHEADPLFNQVVNSALYTINNLRETDLL